MFPQARLVSLQLDEESMKREPLPPAKEAPLTFGSSYVQELLGGDNDVNDKNQPTRKPQFRLRLAISNRLYMILCSVTKVLDMIAKEQQCYHIDIFMILIEISAGWDWERGVLYFTSSPSTAPYIQHVYR